MSTPVSAAQAPHNGAGNSTTRRNAPTGRQLQLVLLAAQRRMLDTGEVSPSKITNLLRRFEQTLARTHVSFHEFLTDQTSRNRVFAADTGLRSLLGYLDPTGVKAARNVDRQRRA